jgi:hypothetical protein
VLSAHLAAGVTTPLILGSHCVRRSPRWQCSLTADILVTAYHQLATWTMCSHRQLFGHSVCSTRHDGGVPISLTLRLRCLICSPRWLARFTDACHPLVVPQFWSHRQHSGRRMTSARHAGSVLTAPTIHWPHVIRSPRRRCGRPANLPAAVRLPLAALNIPSPPDFRTPRRLSVRRMPSARRATSVLATPTFCSPRAICSPRQWCARPANFPVASCVLLTAPTVC